jgi:hypothetical protein
LRDDEPRNFRKRFAEPKYDRAAPAKLFLPVFLGVSFHRLLGMSARVNGVRPRGVSMVRRLLVVSTLVMLGRLSMVAGGVCQMFRGLLVVFYGFLRHLCSSANEPELTTTTWQSSR